MMLPILLFLHLLKFIVIHPRLVRLGERLIDKVIVKCLMQTFALMRWTEVFHKEDKEFDFVKAKKGELVVDRKKHINGNE